VRHKGKGGWLRVTKERETSSPEGLAFDFDAVRYIADFDKAVNAAIRHGLQDLAEKRRLLWVYGYLGGRSMRVLVKTVGVSERHIWRMRSELEDLIGVECWLRGFCATVAGAEDFDPQLVYFSTKSAILEKQAGKSVRWRKSA
jgi:hypothetical protein